MELYADQLQVKKEIYHNFNNGHLRVVLGASCAFGKTAVATSIVLDAISKGLTPLFVVNQIQLVKQAARHFVEEGIKISIIQGDNTYKNENGQAVIASIQSLANRRLPDIDFIIIDEGHIFYEAHEVLLNTFNNVKTLLLSATPMRKGLGKYFTALVRSKTMRELIEDGRLTPYRYYAGSSADMSKVKITGDDYNKKDSSKAMNTPVLNGKIVENWLLHGEGSKTICFPVDIAHSKSIVEKFNAKGISFKHVDAYTTDDERKEIFKEFNDGDLVGLSSVGVLSTGFDAPIARCMINASPTKSEMRFIQKCGRIARKYEGKHYSILIDHTGDIADRHGFPHEFEIPDLDNSDIDRPDYEKPLPKLPKPCVDCGMLMDSNMFTCPGCGKEREKIREVEQTDEVLGEIGKTKKEKFNKHAKQYWYSMFLYHCREKGYKEGWVAHKYRERIGVWPRGLYDVALEPTAEFTNYLTYLNIKNAKSRKNKHELA